MIGGTAMERLTKPLPDASGHTLKPDALSQTPAGWTGAAVERLARFENLYAHAIEQQEEVAKRLETMRLEGKKNSYQFKELLGKKMVLNNTLTLFRMFELE